MLQACAEQAATAQRFQDYSIVAFSCSPFQRPSKFSSTVAYQRRQITSNASGVRAVYPNLHESKRKVVRKQNVVRLFSSSFLHSCSSQA